MYDRAHQRLSECVVRIEHPLLDDVPVDRADQQCDHRRPLPTRYFFFSANGAMFHFLRIFAIVPFL